MIFVQKPEIQGGDEPAVDVLSEVPRDERMLAYADSDEEVYATARRVDDEYGDEAFMLQMSDRAEEGDQLQSGHFEVAPLPFVDHHAITYDEFNKEFYEENPVIAAMSVSDVQQYRRSLGKCGCVNISNVSQICV